MACVGMSAFVNRVLLCGGELEIRLGYLCVNTEKQEISCRRLHFHVFSEEFDFIPRRRRPTLIQFDFVGDQLLNLDVFNNVN